MIRPRRKYNTAFCFCQGIVKKSVAPTASGKAVYFPKWIGFDGGHEPGKVNRLRLLIVDRSSETRENYKNTLENLK